MILFLPVALCWQGCAKLIEIDPPLGIIGTEATFSTNEQANSAMAGIYTQMMGNQGGMSFSNGGLSVYAGLSSDELVPFSGTDNEPIYQLWANKLDYTNSTPHAMLWRMAYKYIYHANSILEGIEASGSLQFETAKREAYRGESLFIRAFNYFYLTNFYGDVPLVLTSDYRKVSNMKRTPQAEVYAQVVRDLEEAIRLMPGDFSEGGGERVRPNKWAAEALLARVQLYRGQWEEAERHAGNVIGENMFALAAAPSGTFLKTSREAIWQLKPQLQVLPNNSVWDAVNFVPREIIADDPPEYLAVILDPAVFAAYSIMVVPMYYLTPEAVAVFDLHDKRRRQWLDSVPTPSAEPWNGVPIFYPSKYKNREQKATGTPTEYQVVLRLGEQYLIRAEARAQLNNLDGAKADIDSIRHRAGLEPATAAGKVALLEAVALERQRELFAEWGHRWLDLKRTGRAQAVLGSFAIKQPWDNNQLLYPIAPEEISANPNLKQNPGY